MTRIARGMAWALFGLQVAALSACYAAPSQPIGAARGAKSWQARTAEADLYPIAPGSRWEYTLHQRQDDGPVKQRPMTISIASSRTLDDGGVEAVLERRYENWSPPKSRVLRYPDRVVLSRLSDPIDGPSITVLRLPLAQGAEWPGRPLGGGHLETIRYMGEEAVTVPSGTYRAQRVDHVIAYAQGGSDTLNYWYAPGVGVVKMTERTTLWQGDTAIHLESTGVLDSYTPGQ